MSQAAVTCNPCDIDLPVAPEANCSIGFAPGEISRLLIGNKTFGFTDIENAVEHAARQSQTATTDLAIRNLRVIGTMAQEFGDEQEFGTLGTIYGPSAFTGTFKIYDYTQEMNQFIRSLACNGQYAVWPITSDGEILGGNDGILVVLKGRFVIPESYKEKRYFELTFKKLMEVGPQQDTYPLDMDL
jgi:hypothetical protein